MKKYLKPHHIIVLILGIIGLIFRLYVIKQVPTTQLYDFESYYKIADSLYKGMGFQLDGYPVAFQGMGYSTLLGVWFKLFNSNTELLAKQLNVILSMMSIGLIYYILHQLTRNKKMMVGIMAAVILLPQHILYLLFHSSFADIENDISHLWQQVIMRLTA